MWAMFLNRPPTSAATTQEEVVSGRSWLSPLEWLLLEGLSFFRIRTVNNMGWLVLFVNRLDCRGIPDRSKNCQSHRNAGAEHLDMSDASPHIPVLAAEENPGVALPFPKLGVHGIMCNDMLDGASDKAAATGDDDDCRMTRARDKRQQRRQRGRGMYCAPLILQRGYQERV